MFSHADTEHIHFPITAKSYDEKCHDKTKKTQEDAHNHFPQEKEKSRCRRSPNLRHRKRGTLRVDTESRISLLSRIPEMLLSILAAHLPLALTTIVSRLVPDSHSQ